MKAFWERKVEVKNKEIKYLLGIEDIARRNIKMNNQILNVC